AHAVETHEHKACDEITIHIHEKEVECDLHDFQLTPSHFHLETYPEFLEETLISTEINWATPSFISVEKHHFFLRGPPVIQLCS
nr:hypothetical protein [Bacteroidota bacterium]